MSPTRPRIRRPERGTWGPDLRGVLQAVTALGLVELLSSSRPTLVALRFTGQQRGSALGVPASAWNDCLGVLVPDPAAALGYQWVSGRGTADPGREAIERTGGISVHPAGCARIRPGLYQRSHGGGYHQWKTSRPAFRQVRELVSVAGEPGTERWDGQAWQHGDEIAPVSGANWHTIPTGTTVQRAIQRGVWHYSQACPVTLDADVHEEMRAAGGWTPEIDGCSLDLLVIDWGGPVSQPYNPGA